MKLIKFISVLMTITMTVGLCDFGFISKARAGDIKGVCVPAPGYPCGSSGGGSWGGGGPSIWEILKQRRVRKEKERKEREKQESRERVANIREATEEADRYFSSGKYDDAMRAYQQIIKTLSADNSFYMIFRDRTKGYYDHAIERIKRIEDYKEFQAEQARGMIKSDEAKAKMDKMLENLAKEFGTTTSSFDSSSDTSDSLDFVAPGEPLFSKGSKTSAPVDLRLMDPNHPMVVQQNVVSGGLKPSAEALRVDSERLSDAVAAQKKTSTGNKQRTEVLLDALEVGQTDWRESWKYLKEARTKYPKDMAIRDAFEFFKGMTSGLDQVQDLRYKEFYREMLSELDEETMKALLPDKKVEGYPDLDYKTWALIERAKATLRDETHDPDYETALRLLRQARKRSPDHLGLRDRTNFIDGLNTAQGMGLTE